MARPKTSEAFDDALAQIEQISRLSDGLALVFLSAPATHAREGLERIAEALGGEREIFWHALDHQGADLSGTLASATGRPALLVQGLEGLLDQDRHDVEQGLNLARDPLGSSRALIVFWIDGRLLDEFRQHCPDLFHWRSLLLTLTEDDLTLPAMLVELREYVHRLHQARPIHPNLYFEPKVRPSGGERRVALSTWAGGVAHGCLEGAPGSGKSIGVAMYAADQARRAGDKGTALPLLLAPARVRVAPTRDDDLLFALRAIPDALDETLSAHLLHRYCQAGELQLILDGYDEISPSDHGAWFDWLVRLRRDYPHLRTLLVSRPHVFRSPDWQRAEVVPWGWETIASYIGKKIPHIRQRAKLVERLRETRLLEMASSPILLSSLVEVYRRTGSLPADRMSLLQVSVDGMLLGQERAKSLSRLRSATSPQTLRRQLAVLALRLLRRGNDVFRYEDLASWANPDEDIHYLEHRAGMIRMILPDTYRYSHRSWLEFFAAEGLVELGARAALPLMLEHRDDPLWADVLALAVPRLLEVTSEGEVALRKELVGLIAATDADRTPDS